MAWDKREEDLKVYFLKYNGVVYSSYIISRWDWIEVNDRVITFDISQYTLQTNDLIHVLIHS